MKSFLLIIFALVMTTSYAKYRAVTLINPPFIQKNGDGVLEGFCIDLMKHITEITRHQYGLYLSPNGYGFNFHGKWTGMVGELLKNKADIAVADLTITNERKAVVDFTIPFFASGISALMPKSRAEKIKSWADFVNQTDLSFGILGNGPTHRTLESAEDPVVKNVWRMISSNQSNFVVSVTDALRRMTSGKFVFIGESSHNEYISSHRCDLVNIDSGLSHDRNHGIALPKSSPLLDSFNFAINYLKISGRVSDLKRKWWRSQCK